MKIIKNDKSELIITHNAVIWLSLVMLLVGVNVAASFYKIITTSFSQLGANVFVGLPLLILLGGMLVYSFTRKARFEFNAEKGVLDYFYQSFSKTHEGIIDLNSIEEIIIQSTDSNNDSETAFRLAVRTKTETIPLSLTYTNVLNYEEFKATIDKWLTDNKPKKGTTPTFMALYA